MWYFDEIQDGGFKAHFHPNWRKHEVDKRKWRKKGWMQLYIKVWLDSPEMKGKVSISLLMKVIERAFLRPQGTVSILTRDHDVAILCM